jgi:hypothetical protein
MIGAFDGLMFETEIVNHNFFQTFVRIDSIAYGELWFSANGRYT